MVSFVHEGLVLLVRDRPQFVADLLAKILDVRVPRFTDARLTEAKLTELVPVEYQADAVVLLVDKKPVFGVIVEAQLRQDPRKHYTWPLYAVAPIDLGDGMVFRPHVIGPDGIPKVTSAEQAMQDPQLAVLSAIAHGGGDTDTAVQIARAATLATSQLPADQQLVYSSLVRRALSQGARKVFDMIPDRQYYVDEWRREIAEQALAEGQARGRAEGQAEGRAEGQARGEVKGVLAILAQRKLAMTEAQRTQIRECTDLATVDRWLEQAFSVSSVDELLR